MKLILGIAITLFSMPLALIAGDDHNHEAAIETPPKGGMLRDATPFKAELLIDGDQVKMYIYDKNLKPISPEQKTLEGKVQFPRQERKSVTLNLKVDFYEATIAGIGKTHRYDLHIPFSIKGKYAVADFGVDNH